jgi:arylsulfatase A-like enzyme
MKNITLLLIIFFVTIVTNAQSKNVVFIFIDDLRPEIGAWGHEEIKTPNIDKLAQKGVSFTKAYCQYANCSPSRKSIMSGLSPMTTGHEGSYEKYRKVTNHKSVLAHFKENGYTTASLGKIYHHYFDDRSNIDYYFDFEIPGKPGKVKHEGYGSPKNQNIKKENRPVIENEDYPLENYNDYNLCQVAKKQLKANKDKPFFMMVGFRKPHLPFAAPKKYWDIYDRDKIKLSPYRKAPIKGDTIVYQWSELPKYVPFNTTYVAENYRNISLTEDDSKMLQHGYYACVSFIDDMVGELLNELEELELTENTTVVLVGDHGYQLGEQQIWGKHTCYDLSTNVPLIIYDPDNDNENQFRDNFVESLDLFPTLSEICGLPEPANVDGKSFAALLSEPNIEGFDAAFNQYSSFKADEPLRDYMALAVHTKEYNYIEWQDPKNDWKVVQRELYAVSDNRIEQENIALNPESKNIIHMLSQKIDAYFTPLKKKNEMYKSKIKKE